MLPTSAAVRDASRQLRDIGVRTPLLHSAKLTALAGTDVYLKCENHQRTGSFKLRGAYVALASLPPEARAGGVVASSAGNHGQGLALAAQMLGVRARIFVPADAPAVKRDGILALGAEVDQSQPHYDEAHAAAIDFATRSGMPFINPCGGVDLLAGQGTVALEILEDLPELGTIIIPVGGGGLVGGCAGYLRDAAPHVTIVGAQSEHTNAMALSLEARRRVEIDVLPSIADGLSGQIDDEGFEIGRLAIDEMRVVSEGEMAEAVAWLAREHDLRVEGSGAVGVAVLVGSSGAAYRGPIAVVISGGNIDEARWRGILSESSRN